METVVGAIAIAFVIWWLAEEFQQFARRNRALEFVQWRRRRGANLLSLRELIGGGLLCYRAASRIALTCWADWLRGSPRYWRTA